MEKKGSTGFSNRWVKRFFELKGRKFMYYQSASEIRPKYTYVLHPLCKIEMIPEESKRRPFAFRFRIVWPSEGEAGDESEDDDAGAAAGVGGGSEVAAGEAGVGHASSPKHASSSSQSLHATNGLNVPSPKLQSMSLDASDPAPLSSTSTAGPTPTAASGGKIKTLTRTRSTGANSTGTSSTATKKDVSSAAAGAAINRPEARGWWASVFGRDSDRNNNDRNSTSNNGAANSSIYGPLELACESSRDRDEWMEALENNKCMASAPGDYTRGGHGVANGGRYVL